MEPVGTYSSNPYTASQTHSASDVLPQADPLTTVEIPGSRNNPWTVYHDTSTLPMSQESRQLALTFAGGDAGLVAENAKGGHAGIETLLNSGNFSLMLNNSPISAMKQLRSAIGADPGGASRALDLLMRNSGFVAMMHSDPDMAANFLSILGAKMPELHNDARDSRRFNMANIKTDAIIADEKYEENNRYDELLEDLVQKVPSVPSLDPDTMDKVQ